MSTSDLEKIADKFNLPLDLILKVYTALKPLYQTSKVSELITQIDADEMDDPKQEDLSLTVDPNDRYDEVGILGMGGMGAVFRVKDKLLRRIVALKTMQPDLQSDKKLMQQFVQEACLTAQLQHPGIVPVHDIGTQADGTLYFTMRELAGRNLHIMIQELHSAVQDGEWRPFLKDWTFRRMIDSFRRAVEAVAFAHSRNVIHRDLKPANIMVGGHGEVLVVDWGLALHIPSAQKSKELTKAPGTPAYMSPEQHQRDPYSLKATSDVWALGCILFEILSGQVLFSQENIELLNTLSIHFSDAAFSESIRMRLIASAHGSPSPPIDLVNLTVQLLTPEIAARPQSASEVAQALTDWLDGAKRSEAAAQIIAQAEDIGMAANMAFEEAENLRLQADELELKIPIWAPDSDKQELWTIQEHIKNLEAQSLQKKLQMEELLHGALTHDPENTLAHLLLAQRYKIAHQQSEKSRDVIGAAYYASRLQHHAEALPSHHPQRKHMLTYLDGSGELSLSFQPPVERCAIIEHFPDSRNVAPNRHSTLSDVPLNRHKIDMGSYVLNTEINGYHALCYPIFIDRQRHWKSNPPNQNTRPIHLLPMGAMDSESEAYVPEGWFWQGGDSQAIDPRQRQRLWIDAFIIQKSPVSLRQYMQFLNALLEQDRDREAESFLPLQSNQRRHFSIVQNEKQRIFRIHPDADGDIWDMRWPIFNIDLACIEGYINWLNESTGHSWRLPSDSEWEKAARGVDGRYYPWGDHDNGSWVCTRDSHSQRPLPEPLGSRPHDISLYGVMDMSGSISEFTSTPFYLNDNDRRHPRYTIKGASWKGNSKYARISSRGMIASNERSPSVGFRLVRSVSPKSSEA